MFLALKLKLFSVIRDAFSFTLNPFGIVLFGATFFLWPVILAFYGMGGLNA